MRKIKILSLFLVCTGFLILTFQNCAQEEGLPPGTNADWNNSPTPTEVPALTAGEQCVVSSPAQSGTCLGDTLTITYDDMIVGSTTPSPKSLTVPQGCNSFSAKLWGAGGGSAVTSLRGGDGAYVTGDKIKVVPGEVLLVIVGQGGELSSTSTFGGGGTPGMISVYSSTFSGAASGGGRSAIQRLITGKGYHDIISAGGGGGSGFTAVGGNAGSATTKNGGDSSDVILLTGGKAGDSVTADTVSTAKGGSGGVYQNDATNAGSGKSGSKYAGGNGGLGNPGAGGGGGGYFGGGGGASSGKQTPATNENYGSGGGAGGSFVLCGTSLETTNDSTGCHNNKDCAIPGRGAGRVYIVGCYGDGWYCETTKGNPGKVLITWSAN